MTKLKRHSPNSARSISVVHLGRAHQFSPFYSWALGLIILTRWAGPFEPAFFPGLWPFSIYLSFRLYIHLQSVYGLSNYWALAFFTSGPWPFQLLGFGLFSFWAWPFPLLGLGLLLELKFAHQILHIAFLQPRIPVNTQEF